MSPDGIWGNRDSTGAHATRHRQPPSNNRTVVSSSEHTLHITGGQDWAFVEVQLVRELYLSGVHGTVRILVPTLCDY